MTTVDQRGFIALLSILMLSAILLVVVVSCAQTQITHRFALLSYENKLKADALADACVAIARMLIRNNPDITEANIPNGGTFQIGDGSCSITSLVRGPSAPGTYSILIEANNRNATSIISTTLSADAIILTHTHR